VPALIDEHNRRGIGALVTIFPPVDTVAPAKFPAANKANIVTPGFTPEEAGTVDDHLHKIEGPALPLPFIVTDIQAAPNKCSGQLAQP
jgi:hypothetical protein